MAHAAYLVLYLVVGTCSEVLTKKTQRHSHIAFNLLCKICGSEVMIPGHEPLLILCPWELWSGSLTDFWTWQVGM